MMEPGKQHLFDVRDGSAGRRASPSGDPKLVPLVVDVDGALLRTDLLVESVFRLISREPRYFFSLALWMAMGKAALRQRLAERLALSPDSLPFNQEVIEFLRREHEKGRPIYLASAWNHRLVQALADHVGFVRGIFASNGPVGAASCHGSNRLVEAFGPNGFDYVGNAKCDLEVWRQARKAILADAAKSVDHEARKSLSEVHTLSLRLPSWRAYLRTLRPHQWLKNLLVFVPIVAAHRIEIGTVGASLTAFVAFTACASAGYLINDLFDLPQDRNHPTKSNRPLASGAVPLMHGVALIPLLLGIGILLGAALSFQFVGLLAVYLVTTTVYSIYLKRKMLIDVLTLAGLYTVRVFAGAVAVGVTVSPWLLAFSLFIFLALAIVKRNSELIRQFREEKSAQTGRGYMLDDLLVLAPLAAASGFSAVLLLALYVNSDEVKVLYSDPQLLWLICPLLTYWMGSIIMLTNRGQMNEDPVIFAITDRMSLVIGALIAAVVLAAV